MVKVFVPLPASVAPFAVTVRFPFVSLSVVVKVPEETLAPASARLSPLIASATPCRACAVCGAVMTGGPWPLLAPIRYSMP